MSQSGQWAAREDPPSVAARTAEFDATQGG
jgi:hypothetical protein